MSKALKHDKRRVGPASLIPGYRYIVKDAEYLGGIAAFADRRLSVAQLLEEMANGIPLEELAEMYSLPVDAVYEAIRYAGKLAVEEAVG